MAAGPPSADASMGPRSFNRGNCRPSPCFSHRASRTSMGPRSFNRGNTDSVADLAAERPLQWGRGLSTAEMKSTGSILWLPKMASMGPRSFNRGNIKRPLYFGNPDPPASMGPRSFNRGNGNRRLACTPLQRLQWGRGLSTAEIPLQRKDLTELTSRFNGAAVFQPRKFLPICTGLIPRCSCFNGAAVFQPRKCLAIGVHVAVEAMLQWGRGLSTAEIR